MFEVTGPLLNSLYSSPASSIMCFFAYLSRLYGPLSSYTISISKWSCRFCPTPSSTCTGWTPTRSRSCARPMPESISNFGEPIAPAVTITSRRARTIVTLARSPPRANSTPAARPLPIPPPRPAPPAAAAHHRHAGALATRRELDAGSAAILDHHAQRQAVGANREIGTRARLAQIASRRTATPAIALRDLIHPHTFLLRAIEIAVVRHARFLAGAHEGFGQFVDADEVGHAQRTTHAMVWVAQALVVFHALQVRQHAIMKTPAGAAIALPAIVVGR